MRDGRAEAELNSRRPEQDVVRARGDRAHERKADQRGEGFHHPSVAGTAVAVLYDPNVDGQRDDLIRAWSPPVPGLREVFHARFIDHAYPAHTHDTWTLFIVDDGGVQYDLDRHSRRADRSMVSVLPPGIVHDGRPATSHGFTKRVLYLETSVLGEQLRGAAVDEPVIRDATLRARISAIHEILGCVDDALEAETRLAFIAERVRLSLGDAPRRHDEVRMSDLAEELRSLLDARLFERVTLAETAGVLGVSAAHVARSFTGTFGIAPHAYQVGRRIDVSRRRLLDGEPVAQVAADVGFYDQAHFSRFFKRHVGISPGRYAAGGRHRQGADLRSGSG